MSYRTLAANIPLQEADGILTSTYLGALTLLIFDSTLTLIDEVEYIWSLPRTAILKWAYLFLRYFPLISQSARQISDLITVGLPPSQERCKLWYTVEVVSMEAVVMSVEAVLMLRVYWLFNRSFPVGMMLSLLVLCECLLMTIGVVFTTPHVDFIYRCVNTVTPTTMVYFVVCVLFNHLVILLCTLFKSFQFVQSGWRNTVVTRMLMSDGALTFAGLFVTTMVNVIIYATVNKSLSIIGSPWIMSVMSIAGSRIILNMQSLVTGEQQRRSTSSVELTTNVFGCSSSSLEACG